MPEVCKFDCIIVTIVVSFLLSCIIYGTFDAKGTAWTKSNRIVKGIEQFNLYYFVAFVMI